MSKFTCCVPECKSNSRKNEHLTFHRFPADPDLRFQWLVKIRKKEFKISANTRVCSEHFMTDDYKEGIDNNGRKSLKWKAVPSQFAWHKNTERRKLVRRNPKNRVDSLGTGSAPEQKRKIEDSTENQLRAAQAEIEVLKTELEAMKIYKFGVERFGNDDEAIRFYTGFPTRLHFSTFFEFVQPSAETMNYCYASGISSNRFASRKMLLIDELFMFLVRVRVGLLQQDLAYRFNIHESTVSRKIVTWANYLYFFLGSQPIWPTLSVVQHHSLPGFKELYPSTKVIIDCTEIKVQVPTSLLLQSQTYSNYKSCNTLKGLIGITPHGAVCFVSSLYTGSISDREITRCSGILELLEANESIMADKGFDIGDLLQSKSVGLNVPPYLQSNTQFSLEQVKETKAIASLRIHVERAIARIKSFHLFDTAITLNLLGTINQIWTVVCLLTNFHGPLIKRNNPRA